MKDVFASLAAMHKLASRYGHGLKPELLALAQRDDTLVQHGAIPLRVNAVSSGPAQQAVDKASLNAMNIPSLESARAQRSLKETE